MIPLTTQRAPRATNPGNNEKRRMLIGRELFHGNG
jgi:hypothetical protein